MILLLPVATQIAAASIYPSFIGGLICTLLKEFAGIVISVVSSHSSGINILLIELVISKTMLVSSHT